MSDRERRIDQLRGLIAGAGDRLYPAAGATMLDPETLASLEAQHEAWCSELESLLRHGWECDCARCYFARLQIAFDHRLGHTVEPTLERTDEED